MSSFYSNFTLRGDTLLIRSYDGAIQSKRKIKVSPTLFVSSDVPTSEFDMKGNYLQPITFSNPKDARDFIKSSRNSNMKVFGSNRLEYTEIAKLYPEEELDFDTSQLAIAIVDIETTVHKTKKFPDVNLPIEEVNAISIQYRGGKIHSFGTKPLNLDRLTDVVYHACSDEEDLFRQFMELYRQRVPDILTGWNCEAFDFPYLYARMKLVCGEAFAKKLSPWDIVDEQLINDNLRVNIVGVTILDYMLLYKKFTFVKRKKYSLDYIGTVEVKSKKLEHPDFYTFYTTMYEKFIEYNAHDIRLVAKIDEKLQLINLACTIAYFSKCNFIDTFMNTRVWDVIVANTLASRNIHVPADATHIKEEYEGAYVKDTIPGKYKWIASFDLASLYPSLMVQNNISPETMLHPSQFIRITPKDILDETPLYKKALDNALTLKATLCANGALYDKSKLGIFPELAQKLLDKRKIYKAQMQEQEILAQSGVDTSKEYSKFYNLQLAVKILNNSLYGAFGSNYFRHYNVLSAEAITMCGQVVIKTAHKQMNYFMQSINKNSTDYVVASDTDSGYMDLSSLVEKLGMSNASPEKIVDMIDLVCKKEITPILNAGFQRIADITNAYKNAMDMKRESIGSGIFFAKKNYVMKVYDSEGTRYAKPKLKIVGHEAIESATPDFFQHKMTEMLDLMFTADKKELFDFEAQVQKEYKSQSLEQIAKIQSINNPEKYVEYISTGGYRTTSGCPANAKGAALYNHLIREFKIDNVHHPITDGNKIKILTLVMPNPYNSNRIAFLDEFPKEFNEVIPYIDRDTDYIGNFIDPMERSINVLGYSFFTKVTLEDLFG